MPEDDARKWQRVIRESVREACETWRIQRRAGPVTSEALEAIVYRAAVPILTLLQDQAPEAVAELAPNVVRSITSSSSTDRSRSSMPASRSRRVLSPQPLNASTRSPGLPDAAPSRS